MSLPAVTEYSASNFYCSTHLTCLPESRLDSVCWMWYTHAYMHTHSDFRNPTVYFQEFWNIELKGFNKSLSDKVSTRGCQASYKPSTEIIFLSPSSGNVLPSSIPSLAFFYLLFLDYNSPFPTTFFLNCSYFAFQFF